VPPSSRKAAEWHDGFTAAVEQLQHDADVRWLNLHPDHPSQAEQLAQLGDCDCLFVKSNWGWIVDELVRSHCPRKGPPRGLLISGVADPPRRRRMRFYDVLFFETHWYERKLRRHPCRIHAFGIDTRVMHPEPTAERTIDWLSVGALRPYKRHELLLEKDGRRVVVGDLIGADEALVARLEHDGVEVLDFIGYEKLAHYYRRARNVLVAASVHGGGERSVLEARACGAPVHVADDNPKLQELVSQSEVWDHEYYARQLARGAEAMAGLAPRVVSA
jgi:glycosyltransferase involved in cell wall biosynthesis